MLTVPTIVLIVLAFIGLLVAAINVVRVHLEARRLLQSDQPDVTMLVVYRETERKEIARFTVHSAVLIIAGSRLVTGVSSLSLGHAVVELFLLTVISLVLVVASLIDRSDHTLIDAALKTRDKRDSLD